MDNADDLQLLLAAHTPLIVAEEQDEQRFLDLIRRAAAAIDVPVWTWSAARGLSRDGYDPQYGTTQPAQAMGFIAQLTDPGVFVFVDVHPAMADPVFVRMAKELAAHDGPPGRCVVLASSSGGVPAELRGVAMPWTLKPPSSDELERLVRRTMAQLADRHLTVAMDDDGVAGLVEALRGLSAAEAQQLIQEAAFRDGGLDGTDVGFVRDAKARLLEASGPLELVQGDLTLDRVGGMAHLKEWLALRGRAFEPAARSFGLEPPRGVLLIGVPGCGKSMAAKAVAGAWDMPLILLDPGRLFGPYVGESEERLREALEAVQAMSPAVLWIDEIEKGFAPAAGGTDGGVGQRVMATFLRWMQERPAGTFVVATANQVEALPPEFLRKGRFDEIFFVDLPDVPDRTDIFRLHLAKRGRDAAGFDLARLAAASEGFSGAEIEAAVVAALYRGYAAHMDLTTDDILAELADAAPLARTRAEDVSRLRSWAKGRAVPA